MALTSNIIRGTIILAELQGTGSQQTGIRPCLVVSNNKANTYSPVIVAVPLTSKTKKYIPTHVSLRPSTNNGLTVTSTALTEQLITINKTSVKKVMGVISKDDETNVNNALKISLAI